MMRTAMIGIALAAACGRSEPAAGPAAESVPDPRPTWAELRKQEPPRPARPPLIEPGTPGAAVPEYARAGGTVPAELSDEVDSVLAHPQSYAGATPALRALASGPVAGAAADAALAGASRLEVGRFAGGEATLEAARRGPARLALLAALARGAAGQPRAAGEVALATARMGHDLARGGGLTAAMTARAIERDALGVLRALAAHPKITMPDLNEWMAQLARLAESRPPIGAAMVAEIDGTAARILDDEQRAGVESGTHPDAALTALLEQRKVALDLARVADEPLPAQQSWFEGRACKVTGAERSCKELTRYLVAAALAEANARATQIALTARREALGGGKPAKVLVDPITGKPFERAVADGVPVVRRGASSLDKEPGCEPRDVPLG
ncbi:MAG TPA: hypothetical protein VL172_08015 [Kofleriaceae bacterium]|jgi:hypothetical protein|nr:hypothetical protein [Kofleriaceae bacterium]